MGLSVEEYLDQAAPKGGSEILTPEVRAAIEQGLAQANVGDLLSMYQVRERIAQYRESWGKPNDR